MTRLAGGYFAKVYRFFWYDWLFLKLLLVLTLVSSFTFLIFCSSRVAHGRFIQLNILLPCWMHILNREKKSDVGLYGSMSRLFMLTRLLKIV